MVQCRHKFKQYLSRFKPRGGFRIDIAPVVVGVFSNVIYDVLSRLFELLSGLF